MLLIKNTLNINKMSLKTNLKIGQRVIKDFKKDFPYLTSNTRFDLFLSSIENREGLPRPYLKYLLHLSKISKIIEKNRMLTYGMFPDSNESLFKKLSAVLRVNKYANCGESADIIRYKLQKEGVDAHNIICTDLPGSNNHVFSIFGLGKDAVADAPSTWGNKAVIVDGWCNIVMKAKDAIEYYENIFKADIKKSGLTLYDWFI